MKVNKILSTALVIVLVGSWGISLCYPPAALAVDRPLDAPRAAGLIGERYDGFAVVRDAATPADLRATMEQINATRRQVYEAKAKTNGAPVSEVGKVYALEILEQAPAGTWFQGADGTWTQK